MSITVVMILRVYAMWNRSKMILCLLLFIYVPQVIVSFVFAGLYNTGTYLSGMSIHAAHYLLPPFLHSHNFPSHEFLFMRCLDSSHA